MRKHNGMRPHDIPILLKIVSKGNSAWLMRDLSYELKISGGEISYSIQRSTIAGLIGAEKRKVNKLALIDFLEYGLQYVFPEKPGAVTRGMPTAHSGPPLNQKINSEEAFVWPFAEGKVRGQSIEPLHPNIPQACLQDKEFYELMTLVDAIRVGKVRERRLALEMLKMKLKNG